jgi:hypothetical protein
MYGLSPAYPGRGAKPTLGSNRLICDV